MLLGFGYTLDEWISDGGVGPLGSCAWASIHNSGPPYSGSLLQDILLGHSNPYFCITGKHPSLALSHTDLHAGRGLVYVSMHIGVYMEHKKNRRSGEHCILTKGQNW